MIFEGPNISSGAATLSDSVVIGLCKARKAHKARGYVRYVGRSFSDLIQNPVKHLKVVNGNGL